MCFVSVMSQGLGQQGSVFGQLQNWPDPQVQKLSQVVELLQSIDEKLGLRECKDDEKEKFLRELDTRMKQIERKLHLRSSPEEVSMPEAL